MTTNAAPLPQLIAHRGNAAEFPENTLLAFESAVALGVLNIEFDVQLTSDRVPVVFHDSDLQRVAGRPGCIHDLPWAEMARIPVGETDRFAQRHASTCAPSLAQTVDAIAAWDGVTAFVEIKRASLRRFGHETVLTRVGEVLRPVMERCVLISFDLPAVKTLRSMTAARIGWVLEHYDESTHAAVLETAPDFLFFNLERVPADAARLWPGPWHWAIYEVRDLATALHCQALGATHVESMTVRAMHSVLSSGQRTP